MCGIEYDASFILWSTCIISFELRGIGICISLYSLYCIHNSIKLEKIQQN